MQLNSLKLDQGSTLTTKMWQIGGKIVWNNTEKIQSEQSNLLHQYSDYFRLMYGQSYVVCFEGESDRAGTKE